MEKYMEYKDLFDALVNKRLSQRDAAKVLGCSQANIKHYMMKFEIKQPAKIARVVQEFKCCPVCKETKDAKDFYKIKKKENCLSSWCRSCNAKNVVERMQQAKLKIVNLKGGCCQICSFKEYLGALEFHHVDPKTKDMGISRLAVDKITPKLLNEINKCVLVCSNCHRMIHAGIRPCPEIIKISIDLE